MPPAPSPSHIARNLRADEQIEEAGGALAVNDMLLMSFETFLRFFPVWPRADDVSFANLRAVGAFLVSATLQKGVVTDVEVVSEAGLNCTFVSPWLPAASVAPVVTDANTGKVVPVVRAAVPPSMAAGLVLWRFSTLPGVKYSLGAARSKISKP